MEIITTGIGEESYKPDQIILTLNFIFKDNLYDEILENGTKSVLDFVNNILSFEILVRSDQNSFDSS